MKNDDHNRLDQLLKDQLSEGTTPVPDFVWDRIEEELFPEKKRRGFFWWFFGAFFLLIMAILLGIAFSGQKAHSQNVSLSQHSVSRTSTGSISKDQKLARNEQVTAPDSLQSKNHSVTPSYKQPTKKANAPHSRRSGSYRDIKANQNTEKKFSKFAKRNSFKSKSGQLISSDQSFSEKTADENSNGYLNHPILHQTNSDSTHQSIAKKQDEKTLNPVQTKPDPISKEALTYEEILALIKKDFPESPDELKEDKKSSLFSLGIYGGPSLYSTAVFKDYFTSGQLSNRTFASSGFELGLQARFKIGNRFRVYAGFAFNQKQTQFNYDLAITEMDYFTYVANGEKVPFENIRDDGTNSCFLAKDVQVRYQTQSMLISLGTNFEFLKIGKFSAAVDLRLSCNVYSSLNLKEIRVLDIQRPDSEKFSYFQPGAGLSLNYQLNRRISLGLAPVFSKQFYVKSSYSHKLNELLIPLSVSFNF